MKQPPWNFHPKGPEDIDEFIRSFPQKFGREPTYVELTILDHMKKLLQQLRHPTIKRGSKFTFRQKECCYGSPKSGLRA